MNIVTLRTPGLGDATYVLTHDGVGIVVDPQRDTGRFSAVLADQDASLRYVLETHLHNDYVSGGPTLATDHGAQLVLPAGTGAAFDHTPAFHHEDLPPAGGMTVRPIHTPGHTPEHVSYLVSIDGEPVAVFSGGSLLVGSSGRPDLLGPERARSLAMLQYLSVTRLAQLPDEVGLYPTHGEGSFCTSSSAGQTTSTIGAERASNPVLSQPDQASFVAFTLSDLQPWPAYYRHMGPTNLFGPPPMPPADVPLLEPADVAARPEGTVVLDARPRAAFAAGHVPGAVGVELGEQFGVWSGWIIDHDASLMLVLDEDQDAEEAVVQLARIGMDDVRGVMRGMEPWRAAGHPVAQFDRVTVHDAAEMLGRGDDVALLDVRAPDEARDAPLDGAATQYVPFLVDEVPDTLDPSRPILVVCASGYRSAIAAGLLELHGMRPVLVDEGGADELRAARR